MTEPAATILCPVCDAPNAIRSLFCAECGTPLDPTEGDSANDRPDPAVIDSQSTAVIPSSRSWSDPPVAPMPRESSDTTSVAAAAVILPADPNPYIHSSSPVQHSESRRGFWLGLIAVILILIILGMWIWGGVLAADTRSSVRDLFG